MAGGCGRGRSKVISHAFGHSLFEANSIPFDYAFGMSALTFFLLHIEQFGDFVTFSNITAEPFMWIRKVPSE